MDKQYILFTKVKQKADGAVGVLDSRFQLAKGKRGLKTLTGQMDAFIERVKSGYGDKASEEAPVIAFSYLHELHPQKDGTLSIRQGDYMCEKHLRLPPFPEKGPQQDEK